MFNIKKYSASMVTEDGCRLAADIYQPDNSLDRFPVLLMRQPYGKAIASSVVYAHPIWYAARGYIVVIQDVRGTGSSQGDFQLFEREIADGFAAVNWAANLPGSNGKVGMYGFSYQGMTQLYAAVKQPEALKVICPAMLAYNLYDDWAYEGGAFCLQTNLAWAIQLAAIKARFRGEARSYQRLQAAAQNLPLYDLYPASPEILSELAPDSFYHTWLECSDRNDEYWQRLSPQYLLANIDLPMLHIGGWFDPYLRGTLKLYKHLAAVSQFPQHLIVGPWGHLPWGPKLAALDYGQNAISPIDELQILWFDRFLKAKDNGVDRQQPVKLFEMGSNLWRDFDSYPENNHQSFYLTSSGKANIDLTDGILSLDRPAANSSSIDIIVHDPWRPVPAKGGHAAFPAGSYDRAEIDCRTDVLTYTSSPLAANLHLAGDVWVELDCQADAPSFDLGAVLSQVNPDGTVYNLTQGYYRAKLSQERLKIILQSTCAKIALGNSLRLSLSAACFPAYGVNPGILTPAREVKSLAARVITIKIGCGGQSSSQIQLPFIAK